MAEPFPRAALIALTAQALAACGEPEPAGPPTPVTIGLGEPTAVGGGFRYPVSVTNEGDRPSARVRLGCQFFDAKGVLVFTGGFVVERLEPRETRSEPIMIPQDAAAAIAELSCTVDGG